eukprot:1143214-Pelagomonas_calceolata.AAC.3
MCAAGHSGQGTQPMQTPGQPPHVSPRHSGQGTQLMQSQPHRLVRLSLAQPHHVVQQGSNRQRALCVQQGEMVNAPSLCGPLPSLTVLCSRAAMVMGPRPPGTGDSADATCTLQQN